MGVAPNPGLIDEAISAPRIRRGDQAFKRISAAIFAAGLATFALLYVAQPLMPALARDFRVDPGVSTLSLAVSTGTLALSLLPAGWLSDRFGRKLVMSWSVVLSSLLGLLCSIAPSFPILLVMRGLEGVTLAGLPAVAVAYLSEELEPAYLGASVGLYISGNAIGGLAGRLIGGALAELGGWRLGMAGVAAMSVICAGVFVRLVPDSVHFTEHGHELRRFTRVLGVQLADPGLARLDAMGALLMGAFVAIFNGIGFRLAAPPYRLSTWLIATIFVVYLLGSFSSAVAGRLADRVGRRIVLPIGVVIFAAGLCITAATPLALVIVGLCVLTVGFFAGYSASSGWVGHRATDESAAATATFMLSCYAGSSVAGVLAGLAWSAAKWPGVIVLSGTLLVVALIVSLSLRLVPPLARGDADRP
jgi:YNFM family putative membrane transporter